MRVKIKKRGPVIQSNDEGLKAFKRHCKSIATGKQITWLVWEIDGVRLYIKPNGDMLFSKNDLYPVGPGDGDDEEDKGIVAPEEPEK